MQRYIDEYMGRLTSNARHQLLVTVSKHLHVLKDGRLAHQKKPMDVNLKNVGRSARRHVVNYVLVDAPTGSFYGEAHAADRMPPVIEFLNRAWSKKWRFHFCGLPDTLDIPDTVYSEGLAAEVYASGVRRIGKPESGFKSGIAHLRNWERELNFAAWRGCPFEVAARLSLLYSQTLNLQNGYSRQTWESNLRELRLPDPARVRKLDFSSIPPERPRGQSGGDERPEASACYAAREGALLSALARIRTRVPEFGAEQIERVRLLLGDMTLGCDRELALRVGPAGSTLSLCLFVRHVEGETRCLYVLFEGRGELIGRLTDALDREGGA